jgi:hypothetical protein
MMNHLPPFKTHALMAVAACLGMLTQDPASAQQAAPSTWSVAQAPAAAPALPTTVESDFWRSTEKLGTPAAYHAYLAVFPNGFYAKLAHAALQSAAGANSNPAAASTAASVGTGSAASDAPTKSLRPEDFRVIAGEANSGAIEARDGDVFHGPGHISVGWRGATKQLVIPNGTWVVLGSRDFNVSVPTLTVVAVPRVAVTEMALGQFEGTTLRSLITVTFNARVAPNVNTWAEAQRCEQAEPGALFASVNVSGRVKQCVQGRPVPQAAAPEFWKGELLQMVHGNLRKLNAVPTDKQALSTQVVVTDTIKADFMHVHRVDFGAPDQVVRPGAINLAVDARAAWAKAYAAQAALGFRSEFETPVLTPNTAVSSKLAQNLPN